MIVMVDYGRGNLKSVKNAFDRLGVSVEISQDAAAIKAADSIIVPGVGAFADAMGSLQATGLAEAIKEVAAEGKPVLGICLGMQLLYERGFEHEECTGLGLIEGEIHKLEVSEKVPHMGWNELVFQKPEDPALKLIKPGDYVYFVHSYYAVSNGEEVVAYAQYGVNIPAIVRRQNIYGIQFHPEKSGTVGANILQALCQEVLNI